MIVRGLVGLAALVYVAGAIGPIGWFLLFLLGVTAVAFFLWWWPLLLVVAIVYATWRLARWANQRWPETGL